MIYKIILKKDKHQIGDSSTIGVSLNRTRGDVFCVGMVWSIGLTK